jgi:hypothetical protein
MLFCATKHCLPKELMKMQCITLTSTLIILDITKTSSNNCLLLVQLLLYSQSLYLLPISFLDIWFNPVPLGMSSKLILNSQMKVSSSKFYTSGAENGRKGLTAIPNVRHGGWIAADHDSDPWFQVDFIVNVTVSILYMQGLSGTNHSVTKYTIASSDDGKTFSDYKTNNQQTAKVRCKFYSLQIKARIHVRAFLQTTVYRSVCSSEAGCSMLD